MATAKKKAAPAKKGTWVPPWAKKETPAKGGKAIPKKAMGGSAKKKCQYILGFVKKNHYNILLFV